MEINMAHLDSLFKKKILFLPLALLVVLPGCDWFKSDEEVQIKEAVERVSDQLEAVEDMVQGISVIPEEDLTGDAIVTMDGKAIVTVNSLESEKEKLLEANPQIRTMLAYMDPVQLDRNLAEGLTNQVMLDRAITEKGIDQKTEYKKELREGFKAVERMVNTKFFTQGLKVRVSESDVRTFYDANKNEMPNLMVSAGGVKATGVVFDTDAEAQAFAAQVKAQNNNMQGAATAQNIADRVRDFAAVSAQSVGIDDELKGNIVGITQFPSTKVFTMADKSVWVVTVTGKEEPQYQDYKTIKAQLKDYLEKEEQGKAFDKEMNKLKSRYNINVKEEYFKDSASPAALQTMSAESIDNDAHGTVAQHEHQEPTQTV